MVYDVQNWPRKEVVFLREDKENTAKTVGAGNAVFVFRYSYLY